MCVSRECIPWTPLRRGRPAGGRGQMVSAVWRRRVLSGEYSLLSGEYSQAIDLMRFQVSALERR